MPYKSVPQRTHKGTHYRASQYKMPEVAMDSSSEDQNERNFKTFTCTLTPANRKMLYHEAMKANKSKSWIINQALDLRRAVLKFKDGVSYD